MKTNEKIKLFTHNDLDGVSCAILCKLLGIDVDVEYCTYKDIDASVLAFLLSQGLTKHDKIIITDISVSESTAELLDQYNNFHSKQSVILLDHHKTATFLNKYKWALVKTEEDGILVSGTSLLYKVFKPKFDVLDNAVMIKNYVDIVRRYDTWEWTDNKNNGIEKKYNHLLNIYGIDNFVARTTYNLNMNFNVYEFNRTENLILSGIEEKINEKTEFWINNIYKTNFDGYKIGIILLTDNVSEISNKLCKIHKDIDFVMVINMDMSTATITTISDDIDMSEIAKNHGGGGHKKIAGFSVTNIIENMVEGIIKNMR